MKAANPKSLGEFSSYKEYLREKLGRGVGRFGSKASFAKALRCHPAYVSLVLNGKGHFSLEQGELANEFFAHSEADSHLFLLLLQRERAGTPALTAYFNRQLEAARTENKSLGKRLRAEKQMPEQQKATYMSSWIYSSVHAAVMCPDLRTVPALANYFGQSDRTIRKVLAFLVQAGMVKEERGKFSAGSAAFHYGKDPAFHAGWRMRSSQNALAERADDLHYSSVISLARKDLPKVREILIQAIEEIRQLVKDSPEEEVAHYAADFFSLRD